MGFFEDDRIRRKNLQHSMAHELIKQYKASGLNKAQINEKLSKFNTSNIRNEYIMIAISIVKEFSDDEVWPDIGNSDRSNRSFS